MAEAAAEWNPESGCTEPCPVHPGSILKFYCPNHSTFVCGNCLVEYHDDCECGYIPDIASDYQDSDEAREFRDKVGSIVKRIENMTIDSSEKVLHDIHDYRAEINAVLDKCRAALVDKLPHIQTKSNAYRTSDTKDKGRSPTQEHLKQTKLIQHTGDGVDASIQTTDGDTKPNLLSLEHIYLSEQDEQPITYTFKRNNAFVDLLQSGSKALGVISPFVQEMGDQVATTFHGNTNSATAEKFTQTSETVEEEEDVDSASGTEPKVNDNMSDAESSVIHPDINRCSINFANLITMGSINAKVSSGEGVCDITGIDCIPFDKLVIADRKQQCLALVDTLGRRVLKFICLSSKPFDVASLPQNQVAVTLPFEKAFEIYYICHQFNSIHHVKKVSVDGECYGVAYKSGKLVLSFQSPPKIQILNQNGKVYKSFIPTIQGRRILEHPYYVTVTYGREKTYQEGYDAIYVSDQFKKVLVKLSMSGEVLFSLKQDTKYNNVPFVPTGICPAGRGNVLACCNGMGETMISLVSHDGRTLRNFLHKNKQFYYHPYALAYNQIKERLYVAYSGYRHFNQDRYNEIDVFQIHGDSVW